MQAESIAARAGGFAVALATLLLLSTSVGAETTGAFSGAKVNGGSVSHSVQNGVHMLTLSNDFEPPQTPDPHWRLVDSKGNTYLLQRVQIKDGGYNRSVAVPAEVPDVARVQMWCAFAETLLGEASFDKPVPTGRGM